MSINSTEQKKEMTTKETFQSVFKKFKNLGQAFKREANETVLAAKILKNMLQKKEVSPEQIEFLKSQSADLGKALAIIGLQAIPGSSIAIIALEKIAQKHGFSLFPQDQTDPKTEESVKPSENKNV